MVPAGIAGRMLLTHRRSTVWPWGWEGAADLHRGRGRTRSPISPADPDLGSRSEDTPSLAQSRGSHDSVLPHMEGQICHSIPPSTSAPPENKGLSGLSEPFIRWVGVPLGPQGGSQGSSPTLPASLVRLSMPQLRPRAVK